MNLLCFTLEGSTESIYQPAHNPPLKEVLPKYPCSPARLRRKPEWAGSDPSINSDQPQNATKLKRENRRSCVPAFALETECLEEITSPACCTSAGKGTSLHHNHMRSRSSSQSSVLMGQTKERTPTDSPAQHPEHTSVGLQSGPAADSTQSTGRLKKFQKLVHMAKGHQTDKTTDSHCLTDVVKGRNSVLTCISLGKRPEKTSSKPAASPQQQLLHDARDLPDDPEGGDTGHIWRPEAWPLLHHTCQEHAHELWTCSSSLPLRRNADWDRFERLIRELDSKQSDLTLPQMIHSITDLHLRQNAHRDSERDRVETREDGCQRMFIERHRKSRNSLESLYSLTSGQSSSSGVTSDCSSNRDSLKLEDDLLPSKQFCCRARVHTECVPSPYDTQSLRLKVGDVIDVIAKPPMGIWTGLLNGRIGNFKFVYVDVLTDQSSEENVHEVRHKSILQEVLRPLSLEEYSSSLQLSGYQTVDDLMRLRESDLMELKVTDPEHRQRLLTAVDSLQKLLTDGHVENKDSQDPEDSSEDKKNARDSGCLMTSESPDICSDEQPTSVRAS